MAGVIQIAALTSGATVTEWKGMRAAMIQDVDERRREIRVRTDDGGTSIVRYDGSTRISDGTRELRPDSLRSGDEISVRLGRSGAGEQYADAIRVIDQRSGSRR
jgi:hypothetical protein